MTPGRGDASTDRVRRVAVIAYHASPLVQPGSGDAGGMTVYVLRLAAALAERGVATDIFTRSTGTGRSLVEPSPSVRVVRIQAGPDTPIDKERAPEFVDAFAAGVRAFATAQRIRYDVVHAHYWQSGLAGMQIARSWGAPLVQSFHTLGKVKNRYLPPGDTPEPVSRLEGEAEVIRAADVLVASTDDESEQLARLYGASKDRVKTIHPGVDHGMFSAGSRDEARTLLGLDRDEAVILVVGRIQPLKGMDLTIRAAAELEPALDRPLRVIVVGGSSGRTGTVEADRLRLLAEKVGLGSRMSFVGSQPHEQLPLFYRAADVLAVCSHSETFGLAALEAHACGTPVVSTAVGGVAHVVRDGRSGFLLRSRDASTLAARLKTLLSDTDLARSFGAAAVRSAALFSWQQTATAFLDLYECLVREDSPESCTC